MFSVRHAYKVNAGNNINYSQKNMKGTLEDINDYVYYVYVYVYLLPYKVNGCTHIQYIAFYKIV